VLISKGQGRASYSAGSSLTRISMY
jgi:hypothetical protein